MCLQHILPILERKQKLNMKVKCGVDIIEISRIKDSIENLGESFLNWVFTKKEIEYCESKGRAKYQHYAARFAVKEATFKAVSEDISNKYDTLWKDIETTNDEQGRPSTTISILQNDKIENIDVSISHCKEYAVANVVVLYK